VEFGHDPIEDALQKCFNQVTRPVAYFLCLLGWRPFPFIAAHPHHVGYRVLDGCFVLLVFGFLSFSYLFGLYYSINVSRAALISEYIMEAVVSFFLWVSSNTRDKRSQDRLTQTLTNDLIVAGYVLLIYLAYALWVTMALSMQLVRETPLPTPYFVLLVLVISLGNVVEHAVYVATIVLYWIICRLHMRYLDSIRDRLMTRMISLSRATRDIASIKKLIGDTNQGWGVASSFLAFSLGVQAVFIQIKFFEGEQFHLEFAQAGVGFALSIGLFFASVFPASLVCWSADRLKGMSWVRALFCFWREGKKRRRKKI